MYMMVLNLLAYIFAALPLPLSIDKILLEPPKTILTLKPGNFSGNLCASGVFIPIHGVLNPARAR